MKLKIKFDLDNADFDNHDGGIVASSVSRVVAEIAERIEVGATADTIRDRNGNTIGKWSIK